MDDNEGCLNLCKVLSVVVLSAWECMSNLGEIFWHFSPATPADIKRVFTSTSIEHEYWLSCVFLP